MGIHRGAPDGDGQTVARLARPRHEFRGDRPIRAAHENGAAELQDQRNVIGLERPEIFVRRDLEVVTAREQKIEIRSGSGLSEDEIKRMVTDAEAHAEEDKRQRELAEARNTGENAAYQAERQLTELGDSVDSASKDQIEAAIKDVRESLTSEDAEAITAKTDALNTAFHKVSEAMYQRAQEQSAADTNGGGTDGAASPNGDSAEEDVVDAEVVDEGK